MATPYFRQEERKQSGEALAFSLTIYLYARGEGNRVWRVVSLWLHRDTHCGEIVRVRSNTMILTALLIYQCRQYFQQNGVNNTEDHAAFSQ